MIIYPREWHKGPGVGVRDSKDPDGPKLVVARDTFAALVTDLKR